jgi:hypothetical protein
MTPTELLFAAAIAAGILGVLSGHHQELVLAATILMLVIALVDMWGVSLITVIMAAALLIVFSALRLLGETVIGLANAATGTMDDPSDGLERLDTAAVKVDHILGEDPPRTDGGGDTGTPDEDRGNNRKPVASAFIGSIAGFVSTIGTLLHGNRGDSNR